MTDESENSAEISRQVGNITLTGISGKNYDFAVYPFNMEFNTHTGGVVVVTERFRRKDAGWNHRIVFIDEFASLPGSFRNHRSVTCFQRHHANCVSVHVDTKERTRTATFNDLIKRVHPPCN